MLFPPKKSSHCKVYGIPLQHTSSLQHELSSRKMHTHYIIYLTRHFPRCLSLHTTTTFLRKDFPQDTPFYILMASFTGNACTPIACSLPVSTGPLHVLYLLRGTPRHVFYRITLIRVSVISSTSHYPQPYS